MLSIERIQRELATWDVSRLQQLGWQHRISLRDGLEQTYLWYLNHQGQLRNI